ncbi:Zinc/iron permease [Backusella circina FSU 941]|nr:Zinc/iron permease [Backusella circina FSU 941]
MVVIPEGIETIYQLKHAEMNRHTLVGFALIIGFAVMYLIDQTSSFHIPQGHQINDIDNNELDSRIGSSESPSTHDPQVHHHTISPPSTTPTIGLIVHAAADGIALGASIKDPELSIIVFIAIMLHKAPSSFALTSILLASGLAISTIRKHLFVFSLSAPFGALATYGILHIFSTSQLEYWTGALLVFSGGTILYVAMHALQEAVGQHHLKHDVQTILFILSGMIIPVLLGSMITH